MVERKIPKSRYAVVRVDFLDHSLAERVHASSIRCSVFGLLIHKSKSEVRILSWLTDSNPSGEQNDVYSIVRHPGMRIQTIGYTYF
jgi:hypothetical protein